MIRRSQRKQRRSHYSADASDSQPLPRAFTTTASFTSHLHVTKQPPSIYGDMSRFCWLSPEESGSHRNLIHWIDCTVTDKELQILPILSVSPTFVGPSLAASRAFAFPQHPKLSCLYSTLVSRARQSSHLSSGIPGFHKDQYQELRIRVHLILNPSFAPLFLMKA